MRKQTKKLAFTLIELLVVITIIGILVALLMPAFQAARMKARKVRAKSEVSQISMAFNSYLNDYRTWRGTTAGIQSMNAAAVAILSGTDTSANPKRTQYMEFNSSALSGGSFVDPWGNVYQVRLDGSYQNQVSTGLSGADGTVYRNVAVWSTGWSGDDPSVKLIKSWDQ